MSTTFLRALLAMPCVLAFLGVPTEVPELICPGPGSPNSPTGTIAYVRGGTEIRLIRADGTGDRSLWTQPETESRYGDIRELAFRPDGKEVAFSSSHESAFSYYESDLYGIGVDGKGLRRITNSPSLSQLASYPKCKVSLRIVNRSSDPLASLLVVYVVGAPKPQSVMTTGGRAATVTFNDVAVIPGALQPVMAAFGGRRWPGPPLKLIAGRTIEGLMTLTGRGFEMMGAYRPVWARDGKSIFYRLSESAGIWRVSGEGAPSAGIGSLLAGKTITRARAYDVGPTGTLLYTPGFDASGEEDRSIYQVDASGDNQTRLLHYENEGGPISQVRWLPDGSGFLFVRGEPLTFGEGANICRFDLATKRETQLTELKTEAVRDLAISPDGQWVVFERGQAVYNPWDKTRPALWVMRIDGSDSHLLVENAWAPAWGT